MPDPAPGSSLWRFLGELNTKALIEARWQAHAALLPLLQVSDAYIPKEPDDAHNSYDWSADFGALLTRPITAGHFPFHLGLRLFPLAILFTRDEHTTVSAFDLKGRALNEARAWVANHLAGVGLDSASLKAPRPQDGWPSDRLFDAAPGEQELSFYFNNAFPLLQEILAPFEDASPIRCWPHHFDVASTLQWDEGERFISVGFSPGDEDYGAPYFYVTPGPYRDAGSLPDLGAGHWHTQGWTGAVLPAGDIVAMPGDKQREFTRNWLTNTITIARRLLDV